MILNGLAAVNPTVSNITRLGICKLDNPDTCPAIKVISPLIAVPRPEITNVCCPVVTTCCTAEYCAAVNICPGIISCLTPPIILPAEPRLPAMVIATGCRMLAWITAALEDKLKPKAFGKLTEPNNEPLVLKRLLKDMAF